MNEKQFREVSMACLASHLGSAKRSDARLVVVITAGNYNKPGNWKLPVAVISKVLAALRDW